MINSRQKGCAAECAVAQQMRELGFKSCITKREARGGDWQYTDDGIDLMHTFPYVLQIKNLRNYVSINTIQEIQAEKDEIPILITFRKRHETMAVIPWKHLQRLIQTQLKSPKE